MEEIVISDDKSLLDREVIYRFLASSYWANKRRRETINKSIGVYDGKKQIGFARIVTDEATMYGLCDVFIDEQYRGKGIGKQLIDSIVHSEKLSHLFGFLGTKDAHDFYHVFDFQIEEEKVMARIPDFLSNKM
ncbi:GNAT family N-acetyltransferase [Halalkalibacter hemicellulosilyticus]|uniref:Acetyltransferase n=1 Tax=Halalkalibacter hemicellulosilyticusJCM 9152 TaxID=1236971 RepID=W4QHJ0_9BACI|nr:GNAT family N-acetyltransferase [Halalkalibacter hemicellulosilyticus]GAE30804.1 acetyltransferase [Halalkalibacter hemicellulosilyticusJCM 9152]